MLKKPLAVVLATLVAASALADYPADRKAAMELVRAGKHEEAIAALTTMAEGAVSDFQKSDALEQAVLCAMGLKEYDQAMELTKKIPQEPVAKTCQMRILMVQRKWKEVADQFKDEDIASWPQHVVGDAYWLRGQAFLYIKNGEAAEKDLAKAAENLTESNSKGLALIDLGNTYQLLKDDDRAIETYRKVYTTGNIYKHCQAASYAAGVLVRQEKLDDALQELNKIDISQAAPNYWRDNWLLAYGNILAKQGKKAEAMAKYNEALQNKEIHPSLKGACEKALNELQAKGD